MRGSFAVMSPCGAESLSGMASLPLVVVVPGSHAYGDDMWRRLLERSSDEPLGASDCERLRPGLVAQPANTVTSGGLALAGLYLIGRGRGHRDASRWWTFGSMVAAAGVGSMAYHGPGGRLSHWSHDAALTGMMAFVPVDNLWARGRGGKAPAQAGFAAL